MFLFYNLSYLNYIDLFHYIDLFGYLTYYVYDLIIIFKNYYHVLLIVMVC